jgi:carboxypeptidase Q
MIAFSGRTTFIVRQTLKIEDLCMYFRLPALLAAILALAVSANAQTASEQLDLNAYNAIREEGLQHSHVMDYAGGLIDGIGPRLTGSPNMAKANAWTRDQLTRMGCLNAHLEDWGEFGMGWQQLNTWVRMTEPDTAVFVVQATPWSPSTNGPVTGEAVSVIVNETADMEKYKGKLAGKIVLLGAMRDVPVPDKPFFTRYTDQELMDLETLPPDVGNDAALARAVKRY